MMKQDLQARVDVAGIEIMDVRITNLTYAPEIAAAMLQRLSLIHISHGRPPSPTAIVCCIPE